MRETGIPSTAGMINSHLNNLPELPEIEESLQFLADGLREAVIRDPA